MHSELFRSLKVIDLSTVLAGPSVGTFFAELGAKVIKVENPAHPDVTRTWKLPGEEKDASVSAYFSSINYGKEYISLDLKNNGDYNVLVELLQDADLVIMNFKKGGQEKLNISDAKLHSINPRLIIGKISGFGDQSDRVAYDLILQAESGFMSMNGTPESGPVKMPLALIDVLAAHHLKEGLLIELISREKEEEMYKGGVISVSLYDAAVSSLINQASNYLMTGKVPERIGSLHPNIAPYGELFTTKDDRTITFAIGSDKHFKKLCSFLGVNELSEDKLYKSVQDRVENRSQLHELLKAPVRNKDADELLEGLHKIYVPCGEVKDLASVFSAPRAQSLINEEIIDGVETKRVRTVAFKKDHLI